MNIQYLLVLLFACAAGGMTYVLAGEPFRKPLARARMSIAARKGLHAKPTQRMKIAEAIDRAGEAFEKVIPLKLSESRELQNKLDLAGLKIIPSTWRAISLGITIFTAIMLAGAALVGGYGIAMALLVGIIGAVGGWAVCGIWLSHAGKKRGEEIDRYLPPALELLTISVSAGVLVERGFRQLAENKALGPLADEFARTDMEISHLGVSRVDALDHMRRRCDSPLMGYFCAALIEATRKGTSISGVLESQAKLARKGNIAEVKDRYILEQLRSAIDSPWSTALPDGIRSALMRSVSEEMEDRFLLENMDKDTDRSVKSAIRSAVIKVKGQHGVKNGPWTDAYGDADVLDYAYQEIITRFSDGPGALLDEIEIPEGYRIISGEKWASDLSGIGREWVDDINPFLLLADKTGELMICDILSKRTVPVVAVRSDFAERFDRLADEDGMIGDKFWTYACIAEARGRNMTFDFRGAVSRAFELKGRVEKSDSPGRDDGKLTVKGEIARAGADKLAEEAKKKGELLLDG